MSSKSATPAHARGGGGAPRVLARKLDDIAGEKARSTAATDRFASECD
jgi:hypothetical protein